MKNILSWYQLDLLGVNHASAIFDLQNLSYFNPTAWLWITHENVWLLKVLNLEVHIE